MSHNSMTGSPMRSGLARRVRNWAGDARRWRDARRAFRAQSRRAVVERPSTLERSVSTRWSCRPYQNDGVAQRVLV